VCSGHSRRYKSQTCSCLLLWVGAEMWSLNNIRSASSASPLFVVMTQDDTGHSCFSNSPLPGLMPPQELAPFHRRIFFKGADGSNGSAGSTPAGGRNISCSGILSEGDSSGKRLWDWFCSEGFGSMTPPTIYQGRSWWTGGSDLLFGFCTDFV